MFAAYVRNPLTGVWAVLTAITLASWLIGRNASGELHADAAITAAVLAIAALKAQLVIMYFMEVRFGPAWLKRAAYCWVIVLFPALIIANAVRL